MQCQATVRHRPRPRTGTEGPARRPLTPEAERALAEAAARRAERARNAAARGSRRPRRPRPTRYGDWEINGLTSDF